ncbi:MAG: hypothetical protein ABI851_10310 [Saprospiraceae bacterium]
MKLGYYLLTIIFCMNCASSKEGFVSINNKLKNSYYSILLPKNFQIKIYKGDDDIEYNYVYPDSSIIYITTFANSLNEENLRIEGKYSKKYNALNLTDTITFCGITSEKLYWYEELKKNKIIIGYFNVSPKKKIMMDKSIQSFFIK